MKRYQRQFFSLLTSALLHALAFLVFWMGKGPIEPPLLQQRPPTSVEIVERKNLPHGSQLGDRRQMGRRLSRNALPKKFLPSFLTSEGGTFSVNSGASGAVRPFGFESGKLEKLRDFSLISRIYDAIDGGLSFPYALSQQKIEGVVLVQLLLKPSGEVDWSTVKFTSGNRYLKIYILRVLRNVFYKALQPEVMRNVREPLQLDFAFEFQVTEHDDPELKKKHKFIMGQVMSFYRNSQQSKLEWHLGPLSGLFPIPYASLDVAKLVGMVTGKSEDPMAEFLAEATIE